MDMKSSVRSTTVKCSILASATLAVSMRERGEAIALCCLGQALIWGLGQQFGPAFTPDLKQAWIALYEFRQHEMTGATVLRFCKF